MAFYGILFEITNPRPLSISRRVAETMIVDSHTHIFPPTFHRDRGKYITRDATLAELYSVAETPMATAQDLIASMDEAEVDISVVMGIGWTDMEVAREVNDYLLESAARYPKRLVPFCSVNPAWGEEALREMERCADQGARGIGEMHPDTQGFSLSDVNVMEPFIGLLRSLRLVLLTHSSEPVGHEYVGKGTVTPGALMDLIQRAQDVPIICAHWGGGLPFYALMPEVQTALQKVYFDSAASPFLYRPRVYSVAMQLMRPESILFGSDYPLVKPSRIIRHIRAASITDDEKNGILGGNAQRLLGLGKNGTVITDA